MVTQAHSGAKGLVRILYTQVAKLRSWRENTSSLAVSSQTPKEKEKQMSTVLLYA